MTSSYYCIPYDILTWEDMSERTISSCSSKIRHLLYKLPNNGTLFIDLKKVRYIDNICAQESIGYIQQNITKGTLQEKHIIIVQPNPLVLKQIEEVISDLGLAFLHLNSDGIIRIKGKGFTAKLQEAFRTVLNSKTGVSPQNLLKIINDKKASVPAWSNNLRILYDWGFVSRVELPSKGQGRPMFAYVPFCPDMPEEKDELPKSLYWEIPGIRDNQPEYFPISIDQDTASLG